MSARKKKIRATFRALVLDRDDHACRSCGHRPPDGDAELDAHHITDRSQMPAGGYVVENGITLCRKCHLLAENYHSQGVSIPGYSPDELYLLIGSSYQQAVTAAARVTHR